MMNVELFSLQSLAPQRPDSFRLALIYLPLAKCNRDDITQTFEE